MTAIFMFHKTQLVPRFWHTRSIAETATVSLFVTGGLADLYLEHLHVCNISSFSKRNAATRRADSCMLVPASRPRAFHSILIQLSASLSIHCPTYTTRHRPMAQRSITAFFQSKEKSEAGTCENGQRPAKRPKVRKCHLWWPFSCEGRPRYLLYAGCLHFTDCLTSRPFRKTWKPLS
jgi:hypothetical protein